MNTCSARRSLRDFDSTHDAAATAFVRRANTKARRRKANPQKRDTAQSPRPGNREVQISAHELEFAEAMQAYKLRSGRLFPTWSEVLEVLRSLGYQKARQLRADDLAGCLPGLCTRPSEIVSNLIDDATIDATINGWVQALIRRDKETGEHTRRVTEMTMKLARAMNVVEADLIHIRRGALLHDIGKIGIPDAIVHKPGPLTDDQMEVVRRHPTYAYE
jgi:HD-GYP domain-containing protein (c-di-GMP phosphodiesterase class II)